MGEVRTVCSYCGVGCGISVTTSDAGTGHPLTVAKVVGDRLHVLRHDVVATLEPGVHP